MAKWAHPTSSRMYGVWRSMKSRCRNKSDKNYGGRGIFVCAEWANDFDRFCDDMGPCPTGFSIERKNNAQGYSRENCVWADRATQQNNRRSCDLLEFKGVTRNLTQWAKELNISCDALWKRLYSSGMTLAQALTSADLRSTGWSHGSLSGYSAGCRCTACSQARTAYNVSYYQRRKNAKA